MRKNIRDQIVELIPTIWDGIQYARNAKPNQALLVLNDCRMALNSIYNSIQAGLTVQRFKVYNGILTNLKVHLEHIINRKITNGQVDEYTERFYAQLQILKDELITEPEVKIKVVFMPYKTSMWDSLESIWLAAKNDDRCEVKVVPIPYYQRNPDLSFGEFHYEGQEYPDYVPVVHYNDYDLNTELPDVIYIHNPYDGNNRITSVDPRYYSYNLKNFTSMLVYVPYFISGAYKDVQHFAQKHITACVKFVDKIVVQSETHKELFVKSGVNENKLLVLGSPKIDVIANLNKREIYVPESWARKLEGKKAIVLNSSIGTLLSDSEYLKKLKDRVSIILSYKDLVLIWRPHPLLEATITSMRPTMYEEYKELVRLVENCENAIIDQSSDTLLATKVSDGMISDISSWMRQYIATGKPVLVLNGKKALKQERVCVFDHFSSYFIHDGFSIEQFCDLIINGVDTNKEARMTDLHDSMVNIDGTCGEKIHYHIVKLLE